MEGEGRFVRTYSKEGPVKLVSGLVSQHRYLFLFSDLLLIAKAKRENSYKLKEKLSLSEVWVKGSWPEGVAELGVEPGLAFLLGWPTTNVLAVFPSRSERDSWFHLLREKVEEERERQVLKTATVTLRSKAPKPADDAILHLPVNITQTADDLLRLAVSELGLGPEPPSAYQLWVRSPSQSAPYPLLGLESPFAILLSHVRDTLPNAGSADELAQLAQSGLHSQSLNLRLEFVLRPRSSHSHLINLKPSIAQPARSPSRKPRRAFVDRFRLMRQKLSRQDSGTEEGRDRSMDRALGAEAGILEAVELRSEGLLFGRPLAQVSSGGPAGLPPPIHAVFLALHRHGLTTDGLFRKPPKQRALRDLRAALDRGETPDLEQVQPNLAASLLKEFLRSVPGKLLLPGQYFEWVSLSDPGPESLKVAKAKALVGELGPERVALLRHLLCLVHEVAAQSQTNHMDLSSLSVCLGPCLIDRPPHAQTQHSFKLLPHIALFLFRNTAQILGEETLGLLSSEAPSNSAPSSSLQKNLESHASHDSGLSEDSVQEARRSRAANKRWSPSQSPDLPEHSQSSHEAQGDVTSPDSSPPPSASAPDSPASLPSRQPPRNHPAALEEQPQASSSGISTSSRDSLSSFGTPEPFPGRLKQEDAASAPLPLRPAPKSSFSHPQTSQSPTSAHDSSTVTETEDEDESGDDTPVVSRQSSKATELETKVRAMFPSGPTVSRVETTKVRRTGGPVASSILKRPSLPSYAEAIARRESGKESKEAARPPRLARDPIRRYDREQLRRKTLGGAEHLAASEESAVRRREGRRGSAGVCALIRSQSRPRDSAPSSASVLTSTATCDISQPSRRVSTGSLVASAAFVSTRLPSPAAPMRETRRGQPPPRPPSSEISWSVQNLREKFSSAARGDADGGRETNYAVLRPPPLPSASRCLSVSQLPRTTASPPKTTTDPPPTHLSKVRSLASSFESGRLPNPTNDRESYV